MTCAKRVSALACVASVSVLISCTSSRPVVTANSGGGTTSSTVGATAPPSRPSAASATGIPRPRALLPGMPAPLSPTDVYAADRPGRLSAVARRARALVYVPNTMSNTVTVIDQRTRTVVRTYKVGNQPQHVVPSYDLRTLYVASDLGGVGNRSGPGSLTPINPVTGRPGHAIPVTDPYNLYFTPDGKFAVVVAEARRRLEFYDPHTWKLRYVLAVPGCAGVDHMDFSADGRTLLASCEFADRVIAVDVAHRRLLRTVTLPRRRDGMPQDVKLSPDGKVYYVADMMANGVYLIDAATWRVTGFLKTGVGAHGLYVDRTSTRMFVTNRMDSSISVIDLRTRRVATTWRLPGQASPDMGNLSSDGRLLWLSGRYSRSVYVIDTTNGHLLNTIPVGDGPHGLCVWPQPGRYSLGHTGILR
jgi:YVTN family beta-propeller protein